MKNKNRLIFIAIVSGLLFSCNANKKDSELEFIKVSDLNGQFELELPSNWHKEYTVNEFSSGITSSDTTKELEKTIVVNINWSEDVIYVNPHLEKTLDSLNKTVGLSTKITKSGKINEYTSCFNYSNGLDSLTNLNKNQLLYILKSDSINGHIFLTASTYGDSNFLENSELIAEIVNSIKIKK